MVAYLYLVRMADGVYKVGRTQQDSGLDLKRFKAYPRDATVVFVRACSEYDVIRFETQVLKRFRKEFGKHVRGAEYFAQGATTHAKTERHMILAMNEIMDVEPQNEFFAGLEKGPEFWTPLSFLQARFDTFCRGHRYAPRPLDVDTVFARRGCLLECEIVDGVR